MWIVLFIFALVFKDFSIGFWLLRIKYSLVSTREYVF